MNIKRTKATQPTITFLRYFIALFAVSFLIICLILLTGKNNKIQRAEIEAHHQLEYQKSHILDNFNNIASDLLFLSRLNELQKHKESNSKEELPLLENEFLEFSKYKKQYDQVRYIDEKGNELIRINKNNKTPYAVTADMLQNKKERYYFTESINVPEGEIYFSPFDLNIEYHAVELPRKPLIRFGTPIYNEAKEIKGILILNYLGVDLLISLVKATLTEPGSFSLINKEGFWLFNNNPEDEWGFMFPEKIDRNISKMNPPVWKLIKDREYVQEIVDKTLITSVRISPFQEYEEVNNEYWMLTNQIPFSDIGITWKQMFFNIRYIGLIIVFINLFLAYLLTMIRSQRNALRIEIEHSALYDPLTGLANRRLLDERIESSLAISRRYKVLFALLYIDLDGFKAVNDSLGHNAGDQLLKIVGTRLKESVRSADTVSRIGGDEFVIISTQLKDRNDCIVIAEKILKNLSKDFNLIQGKAKIHGSIGIIIPDPESNETAEELLTKADSAMYKVKKAGKNNYYIFE